MGKIAFVFSGQGSQYSGMGKEIYDLSEAGRGVFDIVEEVRPKIKKLCFCGVGDELNITKNTQPALFAVDLACAAALEEAGILPSAVAGFSLGEIPALAFAGAFSYADGAALVMKRGELMQRCSEERPGAMAAVLKLTDECVIELCNKISEVYPVNYNSPGQLVCAGKKEGIEKLISAASKAGGRALPLAVSGAFHCPFMNAAAEAMQEYLLNIELGELRMAVYSNVTAKPYGSKDLISRQINSPVLWTETIKNMISGGVDTFIEVGAGKTLCGLIKKIDKTARTMNVQTMDDVYSVISTLKEC